MSPQTLYPAACHLGLSAARLLPASLTPGNGPILVSVKEKLTADPDSEVATTSLRVSLMCPVGTRGGQEVGGGLGYILKKVPQDTRGRFARVNSPLLSWGRCA